MEEVENIRIPIPKFPFPKFPKFPKIRIPSIPSWLKDKIKAVLKVGTKFAATQACRQFISDSALCDVAVEAIAAAMGK